MAASIARRLVLSTCKLSLSSRHAANAVVQKRSFSISRCLADRFFTDKHEWVSIENGKGTVGITNYAQEQLGEIVYVEMPEVGTALQAQDISGCLESVKAASEIYCPVAGTVTEINSKLESQPKLVNTSPLSDGWLFKLDVAADAKTDDLMNEEAYEKYIGSLDENH